MDYLLGAALVVAALAFVVLPLTRRRSSNSMAGTGVALTPAEQRAAVYRELVDLEMDHRVGKIDDEDFQQLSDALLARASTLMAQEDSGRLAVDDEIEREIAAMRAASKRSAEEPTSGAAR
ncbi:MAG: c-type cytochrome biogenesis protein CcmI [Chloroflexi bacterium]|nr:c-type cytochrome biogenesis protein CcmI [Chloroflexota bacterium]